LSQSQKRVFYTGLHLSLKPSQAHHYIHSWKVTIKRLTVENRHFHFKHTTGVTMPYVNIRVAGTLTKEQKAKISKGVTKVISKIANKPPEAVLIMIDEIAHENVAKTGKLLQPPK
jgi:4-oxalocrotonate tautomerase